MTIREAAERLVKFHDDYDFVYWDGNRPWHPDIDGVTVARAYLAEHDTTPIDEAWLMSVGFENQGERYAKETIQDARNKSMMLLFPLFRMEPGLYEFNYCCTWNPDTVNLKCTTRGELRRLASVLGVELREGKDA